MSDNGYISLSTHPDGLLVNNDLRRAHKLIQDTTEDNYSNIVNSFVV